MVPFRNFRFRLNLEISWIKSPVKLSLGESLEYTYGFNLFVELPKVLYEKMACCFPVRLGHINTG